MAPADASHELSEPDCGAVLSGAPPEAKIAELLGPCDEFFRHAGPTVLAELRTFLTEQGHRPYAGLGAFTDCLGFAALAAVRDATAAPRPARPTNLHDR